MVSIRTFESRLRRIDETFQHNFGRRRNLQIRAQAFHQFGLGAAEQAGELVFRDMSGTGVIAPRMVAGSHPRTTATGNACPGFVRQ